MFTPAEFVRYVACSLVNAPEHVSVEEIAGDEETIIELRVAESDISRVIGKGGSIVRSLRAILVACSNRQTHYVLEIIE